MNRLTFSSEMQDFKGSGLIIEAIVEKLEVKHAVFAAMEAVVDEHCILASNTSSLSIASIGSALKKSARIIGIHFFNPAPLMPLVEIIPSVQTSEAVLKVAKEIIDSWKKVTVVCKDTPGFIVNRVARPFYGEALRIYEEGMADFATIDWALTELGGFRMGPFTLMDYIGNDINYTVTETVFAAFYYDPRFKPSFTQKRHMEAGFLGRKSGRGFYDYAEGAVMPEPTKDPVLGQKIVDRVLAMLINEAYDALYLSIGTKEAIDLAMTKGVNYPKGLLAWSEEIGLKKVYHQLQELFEEYGEDRYRPNVLLKRLAK
jgi:3-hydroxybutyryl-CoA dehydrogenase